MAVKQLWMAPPQFEDSDGNPYSSARLFFYAAGSSTKQNVYTDSTGNTAASNPTTLNSSGYPAASGTIFAPWGTVGQTYKIGLAAPGSDDPPASFIWTIDNVAPINDTTVTIDQWVSGATPTYVSATSFTLSGDQTSTYHVGRRLKTTNSGGTIYSTITASAFGALTTITVVNDSGTLDSGLSAVYYGLLSSTNRSIPPLGEVIPLTSVSGTNTITASASTSAMAGGYQTGQAYVFVAANTNTGATTININSLGAKNVFRNAAACVGGELVQNAEYIVVYDGTQFNLIGATLPAATQTQQEAGTLATSYVAPSTQQFHPSAAKAWCIWDTSGTIAASYNVTSVTDSAVGDQLVNLTTAFSSASYAVVAGVRGDWTSGVPAGQMVCNNQNTTSSASVIRIVTARISDGAFTDPANNFMVVAYGDQ